MPVILLFGAGKSATVLIKYLLRKAETEDWNLVVVDADFSLAESKVGKAEKGKAVAFDILNEAERRKYIQEATIVVSLLPPSLHFEVAKDCLRYRKNLLTASYADDKIKSLQPEIEQNGLLFLCEMGLDPGIDHMSAKKMVDSIQAAGGTITSFLSHCGGLVAPESDDNPWHYKISWNPRNIVMAGKGGAVYRQNNQEIQLTYEQLFAEKRWVSIPGSKALCWYPNRDSSGYARLYGLNHCPTFIRTTLRHPDFMYGWKNVIELKLTNETVQYDTDGMTLMQFFQEHMEKHCFGSWLEQKIQQQLSATDTLLKDLLSLAELEAAGDTKHDSNTEEFMLVNEKGDLEQMEMDEAKLNMAATVAANIHDASLTLKQLFYLGMNDNETRIDRGKCSAADVLQLALVKKLLLKETDKDLVVMLHEIEYQKEGRHYLKRSLLQVKGEDHQNTAMAKTVGMPLGIAIKLILSGKIKVTGLQLPLLKEIYEPVLDELEKEGIHFSEEEKRIE